MKDLRDIEHGSTASPLHDLATELCVILLCCDALRRKDTARESKEQSHYIARIESAADKIGSLVKELTDPPRQRGDERVQSAHRPAAGA
jgi:hypothetical protein